MSYGTYKLSDRKCATCRYWEGGRKIDFVANKPTYVKAESGSAACIAVNNKNTTAATTCPRYQQWEKLL